MHMAVQIVHIGRKRKSGKRHPNGKLIQARDLDVALIASFHPDRQGVPKDQRVDQRAGTPLGRLAIVGHIDAEQLEAARLYARDVRAYQVVIGCPKPNAPSLNPMMAGGMSVPAPLRIEEIQARLKAYNDAFQAVYDAGHKAARAVARVAVYDEWLPIGTNLSDLVRGLKALAEHYGLTNQRRSRHYRN